MVQEDRGQLLVSRVTGHVVLGRFHLSLSFNSSGNANLVTLEIGRTGNHVIARRGRAREVIYGFWNRSCLGYELGMGGSAHLAGVLHGLDGHSRAAAYAALSQPAGPPDGTDEKQNQRAADGSGRDARTTRRPSAISCFKRDANPSIGEPNRGNGLRRCRFPVGDLMMLPTTCRSTLPLPFVVAPPASHSIHTI